MQQRHGYDYLFKLFFNIVTFSLPPLHKKGCANKIEFKIFLWITPRRYWQTKNQQKNCSASLSFKKLVEAKKPKLARKVCKCTKVLKGRTGVGGVMGRKQMPDKGQEQNAIALYPTVIL